MVKIKIDSYHILFCTITELQCERLDNDCSVCKTAIEYNIGWKKED